MIQVDEVSLEFGDRLLFDDVNLTLSNQYRYVLVGANGAGKSTFLSLLAEELTPTLGTITRSKNSQIGWMKQKIHEYDTQTLVDVVIQGKESLWKAFQEKNIKGKKYTILVLGNKNSLDMKTLEMYGPVNILTLEDIFGY